MKITAKTADTYVRARIDSATKKRAADALASMGLSISDAIRLLMLRVADEQRLPFAVKVPNAATRKAMKELEGGKGKTYASAAEMIVCALASVSCVMRFPLSRKRQTWTEIRS